MEDIKMDLILEAVREVRETQNKHGEKLYDMHGKVARLEVRSSIFGIIGGFVAVIAARLGIHQ